MSLEKIGQNKYQAKSIESGVLCFGAEGKVPERTLLADEPLRVSEKRYEQLRKVACMVEEHIRSCSLFGQAEKLGFDPEYMEHALKIDNISGSEMVYGGLDVYFDNNKPKVLEINARPQTMGFQDVRMDALGVVDQPRMIDDFVEWLNESSMNKVHILGSRQNPFWRGYEYVSQYIQESGIESVFGDADLFAEYWRDESPDVVLRLCASSFVLNHPSAEQVRSALISGKALMINSLSSTFFGDRGFLAKITEDLPEIFPEQRVVSASCDESVLVEHPWIKLETGKEFNYVINFNDLRRWAKDSLMAAIRNNRSGFETALGERQSSDARGLRRVMDEVEKVKQDQIKWVAQKHIDPEVVKISVGGEKQDVRILHRAYWWKKANGELSVSLEAYGATNQQYSRSKGKINGGSSYAVPVVIR